MRRPGRLLGKALLSGGVPAGILLVLLLTGEVAPAPGLLALAATALAAFAFAWAWLTSLERLSLALRQAAGEVEGEPADPPPLPAAAELAEQVRRLARSLAERSEEIGRMRRADAAILERLPDPVLVLSRERTPLRANTAARALLGAGSEAALPADAPALLRHPALATALDRALAEGIAGVVDVALPVPVSREMAARVIPLDPPLADGGRLLVVLADRTRERAVERMRADFVANASHELRTPLASLIGFIETLRGPASDDTAARERFLGIMAEQSERMRRLIEDLLGLSRIEVSEHLPPRGNADVAAIVAAELEAMAPLLAERRTRLDLSAPAPALAEPADPEQVAQVARNLIENAIRYGRPGGLVRVGVARVEAAAPAGAARTPPRPGVLLEVADDGPGIAPEHLPRLTERFYRVDKGRSRNAGGTGLGLAIVKHIVARHRGQIWIESAEGEGSTFRVWWPAG
jgi:two-component system, OmpR family, phosphate regulon sensor histidine kinase PhoR